MENNGYNLVKDLSKKIDAFDNCVKSIQEANDSQINKIDNAINDINKDIKKVNRDNFKKSCIKNIKVFERKFRIILPHILAVALTFGISKWTGDIPFYRQDEIKTKHYEQTIDNLGNDEITSWYSKEDNDRNWIYQYKKWDYRYFHDDYTRDYSKYWLDDYDKELLNELFNNPDLIYNRFRYYKDEFMEQKKEVSDEELALDSYIKAVYHTVDNNDYIIEPQSEKDNTNASMLFICGFLAFQLFAFVFSTNLCDDYQKDYERIINNYKKVDIEDIKRQFQEKRMEFEKVLKKERTI